MSTTMQKRKLVLVQFSFYRFSGPPARLILSFLIISIIESIESPRIYFAKALVNSNLEVSGLGSGCMGMSFRAVAIQLTADELREIENASTYIHVVGTRYTEQMEK
ncbi:hypothetical protein [Spirosoma litoris]